MLATMFVQGTKMEAVACGDHHMMFNSVLIEGETYDFLGVYFTPTYVDPIPNMYRLCEYYDVVLLPDTVVKTPQRPIWISECPRAFRKFEDVYRQPVDTFAGDSSIYTHFHLTKYDVLGFTLKCKAYIFFVVEDVIGVVVYASEIQDRGDFRRRPNRHVVIMNQRYVYLCTYEIICHGSIGINVVACRKNFIIIHVNDPHLQRHIWEWRRAAYQFKTLAALHVKISTMQGMTLSMSTQFC